MRLSDQALADLRALYEKDYGKKISDDEANAIGIRFLQLLQLILRKPSNPPTEP